MKKHNTDEHSDAQKTQETEDMAKLKKDLESLNNTDDEFYKKTCEIIFSSTLLRYLNEPRAFESLLPDTLTIPQKDQIRNTFSQIKNTPVRYKKEQLFHKSYNSADEPVSSDDSSFYTAEKESDRPLPKTPLFYRRYTTGESVSSKDRSLHKAEEKSDRPLPETPLFRRSYDSAHKPDSLDDSSFYTAEAKKTGRPLPPTPKEAAEGSAASVFEQKSVLVTPLRDTDNMTDVGKSTKPDSQTKEPTKGPKKGP